MKTRLLLLLIASLGMFSCSNSSNTQGSETNSDDVDADIITNNKGANDPDANNAEPKMEFNDLIWDFGKITEGEVVSHRFKFTNTGNETLVINSCTASCGCTTPEWPSQPIKPGEKGEILVKFDSHRRLDSQIKNITILANTVPPETVLTIKSFVMKAN